MHAAKVLSALVHIAQSAAGELSDLHLLSLGQDARELPIMMGKSDQVAERFSQGQSLHSLQHNISYDPESTCAWSANHTRRYCVFADQHFDHGKGVSIITTPERAERFFQASVGTSRRQDSPHEPMFRTSSCGEKGRGIFANGHIRVGSLVTQESPIIFIDQNWNRDNFSTDAQTALRAAAVEKLPTATRQAFNELFGGTLTKTHAQKLATNGFEFSGGPTKDWPGLEDEPEDFGMMGVHANVSKLNHACRPNAAVQWDWSSFAHKIYAVRDIAADEEITMSYFNTIQTFQQRQDHTKHALGFQCLCNHCKASKKFTDLSDDRVNEILLLQGYLENRAIAPADSTAMAELLVDLYEQEGLWLYISKAYAIAALEWNGVGKEYRARSRAYESVKAGLMIDADPEVEDYLGDMQALLDGARKHWSWKYRVV